jgi:hypothetical protein
MHWLNNGGPLKVIYLGSTLDECQHGILNVVALDMTQDFKNGGADEQPKPVITTTTNLQQKIQLLQPSALPISLSSLIPSTHFVSFIYFLHALLPSIYISIPNHSFKTPI